MYILLYSTLYFDHQVRRFSTKAVDVKITSLPMEARINTLESRSFLFNCLH